jgi:hypothetical protein
MRFVLDQLARTKLLPDSISAAILAGKNPSLADLLPHLVIGAWDADAMTAGDKSATWTERRLSRQLLGLTFLVALLLDLPEQQSRSGRPQQEIEPRTH